MPGVQAYRQENAATTVTMPYGISAAVRTSPRPTRVRCMISANPMPSTSSTATVTTVISMVTPNAVHQNSLVSTVT